MSENPLATSNLYICKYQVANLVFMLEDTILEMDHSNILSIEYLNDYEFNLRAILKITLRIDVRKKKWMLENKRTMTAKFELCKLGMDVEVENFITAPVEMWNKNFAVYFNDEEENSDTDAMEQRIAKNEGAAFSGSDIEGENYFESQNMLDVYLFDQEFLNASDKTFNGIFTKNTIQSIVGRILSDTGHDRVLMSKFENDEVYEELLVPALPAYKALIYLDQYYGFYRDGAIIYYDVDIMYILNSNGRLTAKRDGESTETTFLVTGVDAATPGNGMASKEGEPINYISINEMNINPQRFAEGKNAEVGSAAKVVVADDITMDVSKSNQSYVDQRNEKVSYIQKTDNKFSASIAKARMEENECILYITAENIDIKAFTPNKEYQIVFDEPSKHEKYGKERYRLAYAYHFLKIESDGYMNSSHRIILKKRPTDEGEIETIGE